MSAELMRRGVDGLSHPSDPPAPTDCVQLDLFVHTRAVILANEVVDALSARDPTRAALSHERLAREEPTHPSLHALGSLCRALSEWPFPSANAAEIADAVRRLDTEVQPASAAMGTRGADFMQALWGELARIAQGHAYDAGLPQSYCAGLFLRGGDARAATLAVEAIPDWERHPDPIQWLILARYQLCGLEAIRPLLFSLAWLAPARLPATVSGLHDPALFRDWKAFLAACEWLDPADALSVAWFPVWYLMEHPSAAGMAMAPAGPGLEAPAKAFFALARLLELEKSGYSRRLIAVRVELQGVAPEIFALYMSRREIAHR